MTSLILLSIHLCLIVSFSSTGVEVGQQFLSRAEMVVIGLHSHWLNGIDYIGVGKGKVRFHHSLQLTIPIVCLSLLCALRAGIFMSTS